MEGAYLASGLDAVAHDDLLFGPHHFGVTRSLQGPRSESVVSSYAECSSKEALKRTSRANFSELREREVRRIPIPRTPVNRAALGEK